MLPMFAVAQYTPPDYNESNADGTNTIYSVTGDYGDLYDLTRSDLTGVTGCYNGNFGDDSGCYVRMEFGFSWEWHNDSYTAAVMSTNGCLKLVKEDYNIGNWNSLMCYDYLPNQLGSGEDGYTKHVTDTLFPFYTDLIGGNSNSSLLYKAFDDYAIFGWYNLKEYNRASENSFEVYIFDYNDSSAKCGDSNTRIACNDDERKEVNKPDNYGFLYGDLDIIQHDVLIGEQKSNTNYTQYLFYDDDTDNLGDGSVDNTFDDMDQGYLEDGGGILYSEADGEPVQCQSNPLYSTDCLLYELAYLEYQCNLDSQYDSGCELYEGNEVDQGLMCEIDPLYDPSCPGYDAAIMATSSGGYDPTTGLMTDPNTGEQYNTDGYAYDDGGVNGDFGDEPWMVNGNYDPRLDPNISYDDLNTEQQMLVDQGLSPQDAMFVTMGNEQIAALGEDPLAVQFNGHRPGEYVLDAVGGLENYDTQLHDEQMYIQDLEWDPTGQVAGDRLTADVWATEEFQQQATEQLEGMVETYGDDFYSFTDQDWYEHDVATYGQEEVDQWHENIEFDEEGQINWDTFVEGTQEEVWVAQDNELMPDYTEEEIFVESDEVFELIVEDEAFEELISEAELEELTAEESTEEIRAEEVIEEQVLIVEEEQEEVREEIAQEEVRVEKEAEQAVSSSGSSSRSRPSYQSVAISQFVSEVSDDAQTANVIEDVISDGGASASVQVDSGASQSFAGQDGSSFNNTGSQSVASSSSSDSTGVVADSSSQQQFEQVTGQVDTAIDVSSTSVDVVQTSAFEVAVQQQEMMQEEQLFVENFDDGTGGISSTDVQFEDSLTEALATGTGLTEFLSQQAPNFQRFEVQNTMQEQRTTEAVESLADSVGATVAQANLEAQLQNIQEGEPTDDGGYADQTIAVAYIGYTAGFSAYTGEQVYSQGNAGFFDKKQMPDGRIDDNKMGFYRMAGNTQEKLYKMVLMQYGINPDEETQEQK